MLRIAKSGSRFGGLQPRSGLTRTSSAYTDYVILRFFASSSSTNGNNGSSKGNKKNIEDDGYGHETKIHPDQAPSIPSSSALDGKESTFLNNGQLLNTVYTHVVKKFQDPPSPGTLILVRHGESEWNHRKLFTGWVDVDLSERGIQEIEHAARLLLER